MNITSFFIHWLLQIGMYPVSSYWPSNILWKSCYHFIQQMWDGKDCLILINLMDDTFSTPSTYFLFWHPSYHHIFIPHFGIHHIITYLFLILASIVSPHVIEMLSNARHHSDHNKLCLAGVLFPHPEICFSVRAVIALLSITLKWVIYRDHSRYRLSQWETMLQCNVVPHWLSPYAELSLI